MATKIELKALTMLRSAELTHDLETRHLRELAAIATEVKFAKDQIIYEKGSKGQALYLIEAGEVVIETDVPGQDLIVMNRLGPGQFFGWSSLFPFERKMGWTRAVKPTWVIAFNADRLRALWHTDHELEYAIVRRAGRDMANRIKATRQQLTGILVAGDRDRSKSTQTVTSRTTYSDSRLKEINA
jgi:CRP-like cAMP-binding protein